MKPSTLFNVLLHQVLDGCGDKSCVSSTCFTSRARHSNAPLRRYSDQVAAYIALTLANQPDAETLICTSLKSDCHKLSLINLRCRRTPIDQQSLPQSLYTTYAYSLLQDGDLERRLEDMTHMTLRPASRALYFGSEVQDNVLTSMFDRYHRRLSVSSPQALGLTHTELEILLAVAEYDQPLDSAILGARCQKLEGYKPLFVHMSPRLRGKLSATLLCSTFTDPACLLASFKIDEHVDAFHLSLYLVIGQLSKHTLAMMARALRRCIKACFANLQHYQDTELAHVLYVSLSLICAQLASTTRILNRVRTEDLMLDYQNTSNIDIRHVFDSQELSLLMNTVLISLQALSQNQRLIRVLDPLSQRLVVKQPGITRDVPDNHLAQTWKQLLHVAFLEHWNGLLAIPTRGAAFTSLSCLTHLCKSADFVLSMYTNVSILDRTRQSLGIKAESFESPALIAHLSKDALAVHWAAHDVGDTNIVHVLQYGFLFGPTVTMDYYRAICALMMRRATANVELTNTLRQRSGHYLQGDDQSYLDQRIHIASQSYLVLKVNRDDILTDAMDQLWHRQEHELLRPLRLRMGADQGEVGHDLGGVQIEFFSLVWAQVLAPHSAFFTHDPDTNLAWPSVASMEPLYRFELLGLIFGLAVYNGIVLPIAFPLVFYKKLLGRSTTFDDLAEGWPALHNGLKALLTYDGDVETDLLREYVFDFNANGLRLGVALHDPWKRTDTDRTHSASAGELRVYQASQVKHHPANDVSKAQSENTSDSDQSAMDSSNMIDTSVQLDALRWPGWTAIAADTTPKAVTRENREQYVQDYANWLLDYSVRPQFYALARGFYRLIDSHTVRLLEPSTLRSLVEGAHEIDIDRLEKAATYEDGFSAGSQTIIWFWQIANSYGPDKQRALLEFVTACPRVPCYTALDGDFQASGNVHAAVFRISRLETEFKNHLPSSSTCFRTLYLPEYTSQCVLADKLTLALENSLGFGRA